MILFSCLRKLGTRPILFFCFVFSLIKKKKKHFFKFTVLSKLCQARAFFAKFLPKNLKPIFSVGARNVQTL